MTKPVVVDTSRDRFGLGVDSLDVVVSRFPALIIMTFLLETRNGGVDKK